MSFDNDTVRFLRSRHFTDVNDQSKKSLLEMALTKALADPTVAGAGGVWLIYDEGAHEIRTTKKSATALAKDGFQLDHVFERQFISGLAVREMGDHDPPFSVVNDLLSIANLNENLVWITKELHELKSGVFNREKADILDPIYTYLNQCQLHFKPALDNFNTSSSNNVVKQLIKAMKETPWYLGGWETLEGQSWF